jgi:hypothetical protein
LTALDRRLSSADWKMCCSLLSDVGGPCRAEILISSRCRQNATTSSLSSASPKRGPVDVVRGGGHKVNCPWPTAPGTKIFPGITALPTTFILVVTDAWCKAHGLLHPQETEAATRYLAGLAVGVE